jgi:3-(3-hydroxy-phenyl)propionate hydroxylase
MALLRRDLNLAQPDDVYNLIVDAHRGLNDAQCRAFDARLILLLANHVGDEAVIREAVDAACAGVAPLA